MDGGYTKEVDEIDLKVSRLKDSTLTADHVTTTTIHSEIFVTIQFRSHSN
jgi:hypothetical protein